MDDRKLNDQQPHLTIAKSLADAQMAMPAVIKSGSNTFDGYRYATLSDYVVAVGQTLADNGLALMSSVEEVFPLEDRPTKGGGVEHCVRVKMRFTLLHISGEILESFCFGEGQDRADKAIYKAITGARKYGLAALLNLATGDDPEGDDSSIPATFVPRSQSQAPSHASHAPPAGQQYNDRPVCPECGVAGTTIESKFKLELGKWFCFPKKGGCGYQWDVDTDPSNSPATVTDSRTRTALTQMMTRLVEPEQCDAAIDAIELKHTQGYLSQEDLENFVSIVDGKRRSFAVAAQQATAF